MPEYLDIFDANMRPESPFRVEKKEAHQKGLWHQTFHCWIVRRDPSGDKILLQLRGADKDDNPDTLDISVAGHLQSGEQPPDGVREVEEELGIRIDPAALLYAGVLKQATDRPGYYNREFCHTYFYETACLFPDYTPQASEVDGIFELDISAGLKLFSGEIKTAEAEGVIRDGAVYKPAKRTVTTADMCSEIDRCRVTRYYLKVFVLADLYLKGHRLLAI
jgi:8-oxo-dGTP pyrophosphatase MutT (NUDIX family)